MVVETLGGWPGVLAIALVVVVAAGFWRWGRASRTEVGLVQVARAAWREHAPSSATLTVEIDDGIAVYADQTELDALFGELFENAVTTGQDGVAVHLRRTATGFAVCDDGPGIPPDQRTDAFEMGFSTRPDHDGIGLALVASICEGNGWTVSITESDAGGTRVEIENVAFLDGWDDGGATDATEVADRSAS